ncbi:hypothetical protein HMPREF3227_02508 [Corynebacterium sp. CMW7794]|nr:hypothetical protein HMPREF3227_02508 [Corynebacterium sp. CMW7794]
MSSLLLGWVANIVADESGDSTVQWHGGRQLKAAVLADDDQGAVLKTSNPRTTVGSDLPHVWANSAYPPDKLG